MGRHSLHSGKLDAERATSDSLFLDEQIYTADASLNDDISFAILDGTSTGVDLTIAAPEVGKLLVITCSDATNSCTAVLSSGTFDGTNATATFDAADETLVLFGISSSRYVIVENIGAVALSA